MYLVGDAAGLASKTTGEGISLARTSGKEVGKKILDASYEMKDLNEILTFKRRQERILRIFYIFPFMQTILFRMFFFMMNKKWFQKFFGE